MPGSDKDNIIEADEQLIALYDKTIIEALRQIESVKRKLQKLITKK